MVKVFPDDRRTKAVTRYKITEFNTGEIVLYKQTGDASLPWLKIDTFKTFSEARAYISSVHEVQKRVIKSEIIDID